MTSASSAPARTRFRTSPHPAAAYSGCSASNGSSTAARGRPARMLAPWPNLVDEPAGRAPAPRRHGRSGRAQPAPDVGQCGKAGFEKVAAGGDLARLGLVCRRQAFDRVEDDRALEPQPVRRVGAILALGQPELEQRRVEQLAGIIAGERPAGAVGAMLAGREADDRQPGLAGRRTPAPARSTSPGCSARHSLAERDQPRAQRAIARRLGLRDRRQVGGAGELHSRSSLGEHAVPQTQRHLYAIAIGSNRPHGRYGRPAGVVEAAIARLDARVRPVRRLADPAQPGASAAPAAISPMPSRWSKASSIRPRCWPH